MMMNVDGLRWNDQGLVPAIAQDANTAEVLMLAWMNKEALEKTLETRQCTYYSRSRKELWRKGETSGNTQEVLAVRYDCDADAILVLVEQKGPACHTGQQSCFHNALLEAEDHAGSGMVLQQVYDVIMDRKLNPKEGSYTNYLFDKGVDKICKKIGEEAAEVIIAAKNDDSDEMRYEMADLLYHMMVLMARQGLEWKDLFAELAKRR